MRNLYTAYDESRTPYCIARPLCEGKHHWLTGGNSCPQLNDAKLAAWTKYSNETIQRSINQALDKANLDTGVPFSIKKEGAPRR